MRHCPSRLVCLFTVLALFGTTSVMANNEVTTGLLSSFAGSKTLLIGILDSSLTIITKDTSPQVYDVPMAKFVKSKFDLYGLAPVELNSKWPALSSNSNFTSNLQNTKPRPQSIFVKLDSEKLVFVFDCSGKTGLMAVTFSVNPPSASYQEYRIDLNFILFIANFISSTEQNVFFDLVIDPGISHKLLKYVYQAGGFNMAWSFYICKQSSESIVFKESAKECPNLDWNIQNGGFMDKNRFHLFSPDIVYIFEYTGAGADPAGVPVNAVKLSDFFVTVTPITHPTTELISSTAKNGSGIIIAILSVVVVVLLIIIVALIIWFKCIYNPDQHQDSEAYRKGVSSQVLSSAATGQDEFASKDKRSRSPSYKAKGTSKAKLAKFGKHKTKASSLKGTK